MFLRYYKNRWRFLLRQVETPYGKTSTAIYLLLKNQANYERLRSMLVMSFDTQFQARQVLWPSRFNLGQYSRLSLQRIQRRLDSKIFYAQVGLPAFITGLSPGKQPDSSNPDDSGVDCIWGLFRTLDFLMNYVIYDHGD